MDLKDYKIKTAFLSCTHKNGGILFKGYVRLHIR